MSVFIRRLPHAERELGANHCARHLDSHKSYFPPTKISFGPFRFVLGSASAAGRRRALFCPVASDERGVLRTVAVCAAGSVAAALHSIHIRAGTDLRPPRARRAMNDRLSRLRLFVRAARTSSFSSAGRELRLSQPTASRLIAALEEDIGTTLFSRATRAVALTEVGATYLVRIESILAALDEADHEARGTGELRGTLRVGTSSSFVLREIIPRLSGFLRQ